MIVRSPKTEKKTVMAISKLFRLVAISAMTFKLENSTHMTLRAMLSTT
jgi:hypothetical protein